MGQKNVLNEYEQLRIKRMQENSQKLQELGLENAADAFKVKRTPTKPKTIRQKEDAAQQRRSSRVAALPACNYKDTDTIEGFRGSRRRRPIVRANANLAASSAAIQRAYEVAERIDCKFPSIMKQMRPSHVAGGFWLGLPRGFCVEHMPKEDADMILLDVDGGQWESRYLAQKNGLSGGWRGFALDHNLECGDIVIFELIKPLTIQMHIVPAADYELGERAAVSDKPKSKEAKRKTGSRYLNVPVQGRTKRSRKETDTEDEDEDEDEEEIQNEDEGIYEDSSSSESDSSSDSDTESEDEKDEENDSMEARPFKREFGGDSDCDSGDDKYIGGQGCKLERPRLLQDDEESHLRKRVPIAQQGKCRVNSAHVGASANGRVKKPQAVRAIEKMKVPAAAEEASSSEEKDCSALPTARPPKPQAIRRLTNVVKSRRMNDKKVSGKPRA